MNPNLQSAVFAAPLPTTTKLLLLALDHLAGDDGVIGTRKTVLASMASMHRRTAWLTIDRLIEQGILAEVPGKGRPRYRVQVDALRALERQPPQGALAG